MEAEERPFKKLKMVHGDVEGGEDDVEALEIPQNQELAVSGAPGNLQQQTETGEVPPKKKRSPPPNGLSRSAYKKLLRQQEYDAGKEKRRELKKQKEKQKKMEKRQARQEAIAKGEILAIAPPQERTVHVQVPVTFILDCNFDDLMLDGEIKSLASQITRCYSDNSRAPFRAHLAVASLGGRLRERFDGPLQKQYQAWKGIKFLTEDFVEVAQMAKEWMASPERGGKVAGALTKAVDDTPLETDGEVIYLSSDSDNTIDELKPYNTYIIGGLVDRNRHKGICYKSAMDKGIKTAKLPIGDFLEMASRYVLTTNHVNEIMLRWLEIGNWGEAFMKVIPKRKGGSLKNKDADSVDGANGLKQESVDGTDEVTFSDEEEDAAKVAPITKKEEPELAN
jgi:tRNA (guanine9-N1)-methyltransferase